MPPDDARQEDARAWLAKAELDLRAADLELRKLVLAVRAHLTAG